MVEEGTKRTAKKGATLPSAEWIRDREVSDVMDDMMESKLSEARNSDIMIQC